MGQYTMQKNKGVKCLNVPEATRDGRAGRAWAGHGQGPANSPVVQFPIGSSVGKIAGESNTFAFGRKSVG